MGHTDLRSDFLAAFPLSHEPGDLDLARVENPDGRGDMLALKRHTDRAIRSGFHLLYGFDPAATRNFLLSICNSTPIPESWIVREKLDNADFGTSDETGQFVIVMLFAAAL